MALAYTWEAICSPFPQQSFIGLTNALESLLSTSSQEVTHILAERISLMTEKIPSKRKNMYGKVKELYKVRSKLVHGSAFPKKGMQTNQSLIVSPKHSSVSESAMRDILDVTFSVIISVLSNQKYLRLVQIKGSESKIDKDLNAYFVDKLFGV